MMRVGPYLALVALVMLSVRCGSEPKTSSIEVPEGWSTYSDHGPYTISAPAEWEMDYSGRMGTQFILFSPQDSANDFFRENVNLIAEGVNTEEVTLESYLDQSKQILFQYITELKDLKIQKEDDYYWLSYQGKQGTMTLSYFQRMMMHSDTVYVLTFTSIADRPSVSEESVDGIMRSFHF